MTTIYKEIKHLLKDNYMINEIQIPFEFVLSSKKSELDSICWGLDYKTYKLRCSNREYGTNSLEHFLNEVLSGKGIDREIKIYISKNTLKKLGNEYNEGVFVRDKFISAIEGYIDIMKQINYTKFKNLNIDNLKIMTIHYN
ncbi:MAG: hypothetical protein RR835_02260 [Peptostreptococcaceae bacterium]